MRDPLNILCNTLLTALLTTGILGCMSSAFSVKTQSLILFIVLFSLFACLCCSFRRGILVLAGCQILAVPTLWLLGLEAHTEAFLWKLSHMYDSVYHMGFVIWWTGNDHTDMPTTLFFLVLAFALIATTAFGLSHRRTWPGLSLALALLVVTLGVPSKTLDITYFLLTLLAFGTLALSASVRRHNPSDSPAMTLTAAVAGITALALLFAILPKDSYVSSDGLDTSKFVSNIVQWFAPAKQPPGAGSGPTLSDTVELGQLGSREDGESIVFTARSDYHGYVYLRGRSYESYTGTAWNSDPELESTLGIPNDNTMGGTYVGLPGLSSTIIGIPSMGAFSFTTQELTLFYKNGMQNRGLLYIPSNPEEMPMTGGYLPKDDMQSRYTYTFQVPNVGWNDVARNLSARYNSSIIQAHLKVAGFDPEAYLSLPESTQTQATAILYTIGVAVDMPITIIVPNILSYVSQIADYSIDTGNMPEGTEDFALWFLTKSDTGYCVHFASAAAVLLRAAGIPARYVEGYLYYSQANTTANVTQKQAHAWVEYYVPNLGWMILEATPADGLPEPSPESPTTEPSTTPPTTEPSTAPPTVPTTKPPTEPSTAPTTKPSVPHTKPSTSPTLPSQTEPSGNSPSGSDADYSWLYAVLRIIGWIVGICGFLVLQWRLRLKLLLRRLRHGAPNTQALRRWRHCCLLSRLLHQQTPKVLRQLAEKAKFSQHTLTDEELRQFDRYRIASVAQLRKRGLHLQFLYRMILALY